MSVFLYPQLPKYIDVRQVDVQRVYSDLENYTNELKFLLEQRDIGEQLRPATRFYPETSVSQIPRPNIGDIAYSTSSGRFWGYVNDVVRWQPFNSGVGNARGYYGSFFTDDTVSLSVNDQVVTVSLANTNGSFGVTVVDGSKVTVLNSGVYNIQFSTQFLNSQTQLIDAKTWFHRNGVKIPYSAGYFSIPQKHGGEDGKLIASYNIVVSLSANDYIQSMWSALSVGIYIADLPETSTVPNSPSVILTITQV
jgi:hypothetical protein